MNFTPDELTALRIMVTQRIFVLEHYYEPRRRNLDELSTLRTLADKLDLLADGEPDEPEAPAGAKYHPEWDFSQGEWDDNQEEDSESVGPR